MAPQSPVGKIARKTCPECGSKLKIDHRWELVCENCGLVVDTCFA